jgi:hypothetical protein
LGSVRISLPDATATKRVAAPPEVHLVILPIAFLLAISTTVAKGSFAVSQRNSRQPLIRATNCPLRRTAGFGSSEGFGMVTTNLASKHI